MNNITSIQSNNIVPFVTIQNGRATTTSQDIAKCFVKRHDNVLRSINNLDCSEKFRQLNFEEANYIDEQGKPRVMYSLTKDGFVFLVTGFTGKKAAQFKEAYINAFNEMEQELLRQHEKKLLPKGLSPAHQRHIQNVVSKLANVAGNSYQAVYRSIKDRFQVGTYKDIPEEKYPTLCEFLGCEPLEGEYIAKSTIQPEMVNVCRQNLIALINHIEWIYKYYKEYNLLEVSRSLKSDFGIKLNDHVIDGYLNAKSII